MPLNSFGFLLAFLPAVLFLGTVVRDLRGPRVAQAVLLIASLAFYAMGGVRSLPLLLGSILFNWGISRLIAASARSAASRRWLQVGLAGNLIFLAVFKYADLVAEALASQLGVPASAPHWGFPLGISFFTLTQIMYLVDCYERLMPASGLFDHATFVSFFPNVTAGPLVRARKYVSQLPDLFSPTNRDRRLAQGLSLVAIGLFKKLALADSFAFFANAGHSHVSALSTVEAWMASLAYTFEMYFDFSGYSDIAFGAARMLGIDIVRNFNAPYRAATISEFWQRWHISLSTFITTYLYTPMVKAMGRPSVHTSAVATFVAMTIAGIWHGATWPYLLFYVMHGSALAGFQYWKRLKKKLPRGAAILLTFNFANLAFVMFRSPDVHTALTFMSRLWPRSGGFETGTLLGSIASADLVVIAWPVLIGGPLAFLGPTSDEIAERAMPSPLHLAGIAFTALIAMSFLASGAGGSFIYRAF